VDICTTFPEFTASEQVQSKALLTMGINDVNEVIAQLTANPESKEAKLIQALRGYNNSLEIAITELYKRKGEQDGENSMSEVPGVGS